MTFYGYDDLWLILYCVFNVVTIEPLSVVLIKQFNNLAMRTMEQSNNQYYLFVGDGLVLGAAAGTVGAGITTGGFLSGSCVVGLLTSTGCCCAAGA